MKSLAAAAESTAALFATEFPGQAPEEGWLSTAYEYDSEGSGWADGTYTAYAAAVRSEVARLARSAAAQTEEEQDAARQSEENRVTAAALDREHDAEDEATREAGFERDEAARSAAALLGARGGRVGGKAKSPAKAAAARANGARGGRPSAESEVMGAAEESASEGRIVHLPWSKARAAALDELCDDSAETPDVVEYWGDEPAGWRVHLDRR